MRSTLLTLLFSALILVSCEKDEEVITSNGGQNNTQSTSSNKIMPFGASRVEGARPDYESYRYELWKQLIDGGWEFDFIGNELDDASYPNYNNLSFDGDHQGIGGWTSGQLLDAVSSWITNTGSPDIVLFSSPGGNDALQGLPYDDVISNINAIIDILQADNPNVTIIIEQMAPGNSQIMTGDLEAYFNQIQSDVLTIATNQSDENSMVIAVDMYSGFTDDYLADDVHYNVAGAQFIADRYYTVLTGVLAD